MHKMSANRKRSTNEKKQAANKLQLNLMRQKSLQEEFGEDIYPVSSKMEEYIKKKKSEDGSKPESERSAWN